MQVTLLDLDAIHAASEEIRLVLSSQPHAFGIILEGGEALADERLEAPRAVLAHYGLDFVPTA